MQVHRLRLIHAPPTPRHSIHAACRGRESYGGGEAPKSRTSTDEPNFNWEEIRALAEYAREVESEGTELGMSESHWLLAVARPRQRRRHL